MLPPPENIRYDSENQKLLWDEVPEADEYEIVFRPTLATNWEVAYSGGNDTECPFVHEKGIYRAKGKTQKNEEWGDYGLEYEIIVI